MRRFIAFCNLRVIFFLDIIVKKSLVNLLIDYGKIFSVTSLQMSKHLLKQYLNCKSYYQVGMNILFFQILYNNTK